MRVNASMTTRKSLTKSRRKSRKPVIQTHHLEYQRKDEIKEKRGETVRIYKGEHWAITQLQRRKKISKGFLRAIEFWVESVRETAKDI